MSKPFSKELYNADDNAKDIFIGMAEARGWTATVNPNQYGIDVLVVDENGNDRQFEIEVKHNWQGPNFNYKTLHYSDRKRKFLDNPESVSFVTFNHERTHALVVPGTVLAKAPTIVKDTIYTKGEKFIEVSIDDCTLIKVSE